MSKELIATIATAVAILGFLWNISTRIGDIEVKLGVLQGTAEANSEAITELRTDVREIRSIVNSHLEVHARQAMLSDDSKVDEQ